MSNNERKYNVDDNFFENECAEKYWLLGLLASDGSIGKYNQIVLSQSGEEGLNKIKYVKQLISAECPIWENKTNRQISYRIQISSKKLVEDAAKYNIIRNKTLTYVFPDIPEEYIPSFLAGYIEGDGCITILKTSQKDYHILHASFVGTKEFMEKCKDIIPFESSLRKHHKSSVYELRWTGEKAVKFCDWIFHETNLYHGKKYNNYIEGKELFFNCKKERYKRIKENVLNDLIKGVDDIMEYAKTINISFQTIYKWRTEWIQQGVISTSHS